MPVFAKGFHVEGGKFHSEGPRLGSVFETIAVRRIK
jgi:hypothetical protein